MFWLWPMGAILISGQMRRNDAFEDIPMIRTYGRPTQCRKIYCLLLSRFSRHIPLLLRSVATFMSYTGLLGSGSP